MITLTRGLFLMIATASVFGAGIQTEEQKKINDEKEINDEFHKKVKSWCKLGDGDISKWDTKDVTDMSKAFQYCRRFKDEDLSKWEVSNVINMESMFESSNFTGDISKWDVSNVISMEYMFFHSQFNGNISDWEVAKATSMEGMFGTSKFNGDISTWNVANVISMKGMFANSQFNGDISDWEVAKATSMENMFARSEFNGVLSNWKVTNQHVLHNMFAESKFAGNQGQLQWDINTTKLDGGGYVTRGMFYESDVNKKCVSPLTILPIDQRKDDCNDYFLFPKKLTKLTNEQTDDMFVARLGSQVVTGTGGVMTTSVTPLVTLCTAIIIMTASS